MVSYWTDSGKATLMLKNNYSLAMSSILMGMGSLSYGELAGERMKLGLMLHDPEEEHDCFSDNTHNSHFYNVIGIQNVYLGKYRNLNGNLITGKSLSELVATKDKQLDLMLKKHLVIMNLDF